MDRKIYWKIRERILNILFKCRVFTYKRINKIETLKDSVPLGIVIIKKAILGLIKGIAIAAILWIIDQIILERESFFTLDRNVFIDVIIGCVGVAGIILGLYCTNISSIYSSKYANASKTVLNAFQYDRLTQRCISMIIDYIIFGFIVIMEILIGCSVSWGTVFITILWSIMVIIFYSIAGNRAYQLADIYSVADDSYKLLNRIILNDLNRALYSGDMSFQNHFQKVSQNQINILTEVQRFGETAQENNNAAMVQFMCKNIALIGAYWKIKRGIDRESVWFRNKQKYQKWHLVDNIETSIALRTGTILRSKLEHDYWWFEDEILSINQRCIAYLCKEDDYLSLYTYLLCFESTCEVAINNKEANYLISQINYLREIVEKLANRIGKQGDEDNKAFTGIVEVISLLYLDIVLESSKYCANLDIKRTVLETINELDKRKSLEKSKILRGNEQSDFYNKIITEVQIEGRRLTPDWLIGQRVAKEAYAYMNVLEDVVGEGIDNIFNLGQYFYDKKFLFEACIILMRFYEYEAKLSRFIQIIEFREKEFYEYHIDHALGWKESQLKRLSQTIEKWKGIIPSLLSKCSSEFAIKTWEVRAAFPDFLGECYNHICDDTIDAITQNNRVQFRINFENLSKLMLLYQEYIRTDFLKKENIYKAEYIYYSFTTPIVEWAQIGGLAILWGEFNSDKDWRFIVDTSTKELFSSILDGTKLAEKLIEYIQNRDMFWRGSGYRNFLESEWQQRVIQAMRDSKIYQTEYGLFGLHLKTESKLLKAFCSSFHDLGFTIDPSEAYWVLCINPMLPEKKKFHTKNSWEERMNE